MYLILTDKKNNCLNADYWGVTFQRLDLPTVDWDVTLQLFKQNNQHYEPYTITAYTAIRVRAAIRHETNCLVFHRFVIVRAHVCALQLNCVCNTLVQSIACAKWQTQINALLWISYVRIVMKPLYHLVGSFISFIVIFLVNCACIMSLHVSSIYLIEIYNIPFSWYSFFTLLWLYVHYYNVRDWELFISYIEFKVFCCDWLYYLLFRLLYCGCFWLVGFVGNLDGCLSCWLAVLVHFLVLCILAWSVLVLV